MNPPFNEEIVQGLRVSRGWYSWFISVAGGGKITTPTLPVSPAVYQNTGNSRVQVIYSGGTVSAVAFSRDNTTYYPLPTSGSVVLAGGDYIKVTYTVVPTTFTVVPI